MQSKGVKRLLALLFLVLNIVFLCMYLYENKSSEYISDDYVKSAVENLSGRGISVSDEAFDKHKKNLPAGKIVVHTEDNLEKEASDAVVRFALGNVDVRTVEFNTPEGVSLSYYSDQVGPAHLQLAKTVFGKDDFSFAYSDFRYEKEAEAPRIPIKTFERDVTYDEKQLLKSFALCLERKQDLGYRISGCRSYDDGMLFTLVQTFEKVDIENMYMNVLVWNGEILSAKGAWIMSETDKKYSFEMTDGVNAVFSLELDDMSELVSQRCIYSLRRSDENTYYLLPVWEITYVDIEGNNKSVVVENKN